MNNSSKHIANILFSNIPVFAGNTLGVEMAEEREYFYIPGLEGSLVAFSVSGDSMLPTIGSGDTVICSLLESLSDITDGKIYAVVTRHSVWVKRVKRFFDPNHNWTHLQLLSDNNLEYDPILVSLNEVEKIMKVTKRVTGLA